MLRNFDGHSGRSRAQNAAKPARHGLVSLAPGRINWGDTPSHKYVVVDAEEDQELKCTIDDQVVSVTLPVKARDYRMVRFEQPSPQ